MERVDPLAGAVRLMMPVGHSWTLFVVTVNVCDCRSGHAANCAVTYQLMTPSGTTCATVVSAVVAADVNGPPFTESERRYAVALDTALQLNCVSPGALDEPFAGERGVGALASHVGATVNV